MKVLVVTAHVDILPYLKSQASLAECQFVQYSHPLKALDNLAEIDPEVIVWNADDYPRHWKICRSFCPPRAASNPVALFLVTETGLAQDEINKAQHLDIDDLVEDGFFGDTLIEILRRRLPKDQSQPETILQVPATVVSPHPLSLPDGTGSLLLIHPLNHQLLIGSISKTEITSFSVDFTDVMDVLSFPVDLYIERATIHIGDFKREAILKTLPTTVEGRVSFLVLQLSGHPPVTD